MESTLSRRGRPANSPLPKVPIKVTGGEVVTA